MIRHYYRFFFFYSSLFKALSSTTEQILPNTVNSKASLQSECVHILKSLSQTDFLSTLSLVKHSSLMKIKNYFFIFDKLGGVFSGGVPPDSIPNSEVKPASGDNSAEVARCQDSSMPPFYFKPRMTMSSGLFLFYCTDFRVGC